jgi:hypothetical protein
VSDRELARISALLRKAERTDNEHEADAFLQAAQRLSTLYSIDLAVARTHGAAGETRATPIQRWVTIGESRKRGLRTYVQLFLQIAAANHLTCDIVRDSSRVTAYGFEADIDVAEALYASLVVQMVRACDAYLHSSERREQDLEHRRVRVVVPDRAGRPTESWQWAERPVHATTARLNFQEAFALRVGARLHDARRRAEQEAQESADRRARASGTSGADGAGGAGGSSGAADPVPSAGSASVAVALRARDVEVADFYREHSQARGSWRGGRATAGYSERSRRAGDRAGRQARLGPQTGIGGSRPGLAAGRG